MVTMGIFFLKIICFVILSFHFICAFNVLFYIFLCSIVIIICIIKRAAAVVDAGVLMFYKAMCALEFKWTFHFFGNLPSKRLKTLGFTVDMKAFDTATAICWFGDTKKNIDCVCVNGICMSIIICSNITIHLVFIHINTKYIINVDVTTLQFIFTVLLWKWIFSSACLSEESKKKTKNYYYV